MCVCADVHTCIFTHLHIHRHGYTHRLVYTRFLSHHLSIMFSTWLDYYLIFLSLWQCKHFSQLIQTVNYRNFSFLAHFDLPEVNTVCFLCCFQCAHFYSSNSPKLIKFQDIQTYQEIYWLHLCDNVVPTLECWWPLRSGSYFNTSRRLIHFSWVQVNNFPDPTSSSFSTDCLISVKFFLLVLSGKNYTRNTFLWDLAHLKIISIDSHM